jgi:hypothetical protein
MSADELIDGEWRRSSAFSLTHGERAGRDARYNQVRVICLRKESKETPVGAS